MQIIPLESLIIEDRQRTTIAPGPLAELARSILERGLLQPPVVRPIGTTYRLIAGERRVRAIQSLYKNNQTYSCNGQTIPINQLPVLFIDELTSADLIEAEFDENVRRVDLDWADKTRALAAIYESRKAQNPKQTVVETARELVNKGISTSSRAAPKNIIKNLENNIAQARIVKEHLNDPKIAKARTAGEAYQLILKKEQDKLLAELTRRQSTSQTTKSNIDIRNGDAFNILPKLDTDKYDLILSDPPYGISVSQAGFRKRTPHQHNYKDDEKTAQSLYELILTEGFRITRARANLFLFTDIKHWDYLQQLSANMGWTPWRTPVLWQKSEAEGLAPWGSQGFRRTYDIIFYATKGQRGLLSSPVDILTYKRVARNERIHAAEKPIELLQKLIECSTLPGDLIIDPCCGSGSTLLAARNTQRAALGIELDIDYYNMALSNLNPSPELLEEPELDI